ncbi:inositol 2-dehydrogenase [Maribacter algarum]|uniref:Inositol 2-dehydrogenase n=1 Tax=Maribacter algarum (ex Zhang et al. 2020) TaxID=2578118 RepID=A0A5S3PWG2_9FLAO|nr:inositol 2-dehydrogenase [Maribacter algarum]TMM58562.1 inositol 2-dehydrogenase [Maribacter algarum]
MDSIKIGIIGMGRIGKIHLENLSTRIDWVEVVAVVNPSKKGQDYALKFGVKIMSDDINVILENSEIDAVLICSPSDTHAEYAIRLAGAGKAIFCEKPIDLSLKKAKEVVAKVKEKNVSMMVAFNRRFDPDFAKIKREVGNGKIGNIQNLHIISRDPAPPTIDYIRQSGGLFKDMTIHDLDMARFIMGCEVTEIFATGSCMVDSAIGETGDIDTATVLLRFENGATAVIENSRKSVYGYDQRLEVFGSKGMLQVKNPLMTNVTKSDAQGSHSDVNLNFFVDRYKVSYLNEMQSFVKALINEYPVPISGEDGIKSIVLADAAYTSMRENRPIKLE